MAVSINNTQAAIPTKGASSRQSVSARSVSDWAVIINSAWKRGTATTLQLARAVQAARGELPYGGWTRLWKSGCIGFSKRKAEMLVVIGAKLNNLDAQTSAHLPSGWNTLYHLALLDRATLEKEDQAGAISPGMTLQQAKDLLAQFRGQAATNRSRKPNIKQRLQKFAEFVSSTCLDWSPGERELARVELSRLADVVSADSGDEGFRSDYSESPIRS